MKVYFNTWLKNEEDLLINVLPIWKNYPIDKFVFYNHDSTDNSIDIINTILPKERVHIINNNYQSLNESLYRASMLNYSRENKADYCFCIDCDELLSSNLVDNFNEILKLYNDFDLKLYWYNVVENTLSRIRQDPLYLHNYRTFILPLNKTNNFDLSGWKYHVPRTPSINLPIQYTKEFGVLHLQAANKKFYAIKQLWYKHYENKEFGHDVDSINNAYDPVVNNLQFNAINTPNNIFSNIKIDLKFYENLEIKKGYLSYIKNNYNEKLITFGKTYL